MRLGVTQASDECPTCGSVCENQSWIVKDMDTDKEKHRGTYRECIAKRHELQETR